MAERMTLADVRDYCADLETIAEVRMVSEIILSDAAERDKPAGRGRPRGSRNKRKTEPINGPSPMCSSCGTKTAVTTHGLCYACNDVTLAGGA